MRENEALKKADSANTWRFLCWILLGLIAGGIAIQPRIAEDSWWHLAVGRWMSENSTIPQRDPFSALERPDGAIWRAYSWLFEWMLYKAYLVRGLQGLTFVRYLLSCITTLYVFSYLANRTRGQWTGPILAAIALPAICPMFTERPWHMTIWGVLATLKVLDDLFARPTSLRRSLWLVPVYILWANVHIQFVLGLGLLTAGLLAMLLKHRRDPAVSSLGTLLVLLPLCALATLVNPYHIRIYEVVWEYATQTGALGLIDELKPARVSDWWVWPLFILGPLAILRILRDGLPIWETLLLMIGVFFACRMQRDCWFGTLLAARAILRPGAKVAQPYSAAWGTCTGLLIVQLVWNSGISHHQTIEEVNNEQYPVLATKWVKEHQPAGPLFNTFDWGGYFIWELPAYPVSMDGRSNLYGDERLLRSLTTWTTVDGWKNDVEIEKANLIVAPRKLNGLETPLIAELRSTWKVVYEDSVAVVLIR